MVGGGQGLLSPGGGAHPAVLSARLRDLRFLALATLLPLALALAIVVKVPKPDYLLVVSLLVGVLSLAFLIVNTRLELSVAFLAVYLGCLNGPVKLLGSAKVFTAALQDVLILAVFFGLLTRRMLEGKRMRLPPLSAWVIAFFLVVLVEAFNPQTHGILKVGAGVRQQAQWIPFFLFGYLVVRSKDRLRVMFVLLGVVAMLNGIASTYQTQLSPEEFATLGPGYAAKVEGPAARVYKSEGEGHVRPVGLGQESGTGAGFGLAAVAGTFALIIVAKRRRWLAMVLAFGALAAIATGLGRIQVVGGVIALLTFGFLTLSSGRRMGRLMMQFAALLLVVVAVGTAFVSAVGSGIFSRYASISPGQVTSTASGYKQGELSTLPRNLKAAPFGFGLGTAGAAGGFGGRVTEKLEGHNVNAETQFNFLGDELGIPGVIVWTALIVNVVLLILLRVRRIRDGELQVLLAGALAPVVAYLAMAFAGPVLASTASGPYFWFAVGVAAYWLVGPGWREATGRGDGTRAVPAERALVAA
jgi:hypothetical protein